MTRNRQRASTELVRGARLQLAERILKEGLMTGGSPEQTGAMAGRFIRRLRKAAGNNEFDRDTNQMLSQKFDQVDRINSRIANRRAKRSLKSKHSSKGGGKSNADQAISTYLNSGRRFWKGYDKGAGYHGKSLPDDAERPPKNAPTPTDTKRRAKGLSPYKLRLHRSSKRPAGDYDLY